MVLPDSYVTAWLAVILAIICWGAWANTFKMTGKWRFELYYFDFAAGAILAAIIAAFTFGTLGFDGFLFLDDLARASKRQMAYAFVAGGIFNLGNMLLLASVSVSGMAAAFPIAAGLALIFASLFSYLFNYPANPVLLFAGLALAAAAVALHAYGYGMHATSKAKEKIKTGRTRSTRLKVSWKGLILGAASGLFLGSFYSLLDLARAGDTGVGPYSAAVLFTFGLLFSTLIFNLFFMNLPVKGEPLEVLDYLRGSLRQHGLGIAGGLLWGAGTVLMFVAGASPVVQIEPGTIHTAGQGSAILAAVCGLVIWKEFQEDNVRVRLLFIMGLFIFAAGLTLAGIAPAFAKL